MITPPKIEAPALDHDAMMLKRFNCGVGVEGRLERRIIANLCEYLAANGFKLVETYDGEVFEQVSTGKEAMEYIFNLDEVSLQVQKDGFQQRGILLIPGNGEDIISDYDYSISDRDGFKTCMEAFDVELYF